jgi:hypothetical protein
LLNISGKKKVFKRKLPPLALKGGESTKENNQETEIKSRGVKKTRPLSSLGLLSDYLGTGALKL